MNDFPEIDRAQLNIALEQRAAGRDYHEYFIPGSIKLLLATSSKTRLDELAIDNERLFAYRFGLTATPSVRPQVIAFQNKHELLDDEIRWLKRAGHLRVTRRELIVDTSRLMPMYGWFQVALISLFFATAILQLASVNSPMSLKRDLTQIGLGILWFTIAGGLIKMFVTPWRTLKKAGVIGPKARVQADKSAAT